MKRPPKELLGHVRDLGLGGDGVVETGDGLVFVPFVLPGEKIAIGELRREGRITRGRALRIIAPSDARVSLACEIAEQCGGCPWMAFDVAAQRARKLRFVEEAVKTTVTFVEAGDPHGYRRRARLGFEQRGNATRIGYRARRSRGVVEATRCIVLEPSLDRALAVIRARVGPHLRGSGELVLALGEHAAVAGLRTGDVQPPELYRAIESLVREERDVISGVVLRPIGPGADATFGDAGARSIAFDGESLASDLFGFAQANDAVNRELARTVIELAEPDGASVLELHAGHGNLTVPLAKRAAELVAVESDKAAAKACEANLRALGLVAKVQHADANALGSGPRVDVVVLDPPREGARSALRAIAARKPARIVYVSCDPATLARDIGELRALGYAPDAARAFDMFPQTAHVEAVVRLVPVGNSV